MSTDSVAAPTAAAGPAGSVQEANKALARYWFDEGWNRGNVAVADQIFAPQFRLRGRVVGPEGPRRSVLHERAAFADLTVEVRVQVAEGPWVVTWYTTHARHTGVYAGIPPTGLTIDTEGMQLWRVENGMVVEDHHVFDMARLLGQLRP